jgi:hypothetical protein
VNSSTGKREGSTWTTFLGATRWKKPGRDFSKVTKKTLCAEVWQVEVNNDVAFPMIDLQNPARNGF